MRPPRAVSNWWATATDAEKLAQIDAAAELGLTYRVASWNFGIHRNTLRHYCEAHGRSLRVQEPMYAGGDDTKQWKSRPRHRGVKSHLARKAYFEGERDFWETAA